MEPWDQLWRVDRADVRISVPGLLVSIRTQAEHQRRTRRHLFTMWKVGQKNNLRARHHVQRQRMVRHRLLGKDEAAGGGVSRVDRPGKERAGGGRRDHPGGSCSRESHDAASVIRQYPFLRKFLELELTASLTAWWVFFSWRSPSEPFSPPFLPALWEKPRLSSLLRAARRPGSANS